MKRVGIVLLVIVAIAAAFVGIKKYNAVDSNLKVIHKNVENGDVATIFIGGYGSSPDAFDRMVDAFHINGLTGEKVRVDVTDKGQIRVNSNSKRLKNATIQVAFEKNKDPLYQERVFPKVMKKLYQQYHVDKVNFVGHSMGGLIELSYLTERHQDGYPKVIKLATIATPYKRFFKTDNEVSRSVDQIEDNVKNVPADLQVLNMGGHIDGKNSDGVVPVAGIKEFGPIIQSHVARYKERMFKGTESQVQHSNLRHNPKVIDATADFLWK